MTAREKYLLILLCSVSLFAIGSTIKGCKEHQENVVLNSSQDKILMEHAQVRNEYEAEINTYKKELIEQDSFYQNELAAYKNKPAKWRIKEVLKIDSNANITDSSATLTLNGIDSINNLSFAYQNCMVKSAIKDSIISVQDTIIRKDSVALNQLAGQAKNDIKKASAKGFRKGLVFGFGLGALFGLIIR